MSYIASGGSQMPSFSPVFSKFSPRTPLALFRGFTAFVRVVDPQTALAEIGRQWQIFSTLICQLADFFLFLNATLMLVQQLSHDIFIMVQEFIRCLRRSGEKH